MTRVQVHRTVARTNTESVRVALPPMSTARPGAAERCRGVDGFVWHRPRQRTSAAVSARPRENRGPGGSRWPVRARCRPRPRSLFRPAGVARGRDVGTAAPTRKAERVEALIAAGGVGVFASNERRTSRPERRGGVRETRMFRCRPQESSPRVGRARGLFGPGSVSEGSSPSRGGGSVRIRGVGGSGVDDGGKGEAGFPRLPAAGRQHGPALSPSHSSFGAPGGGPGPSLSSSPEVATAHDGL